MNCCMSLSLNRGRFKENSTSTQMRMHSSARSPQLPTRWSGFRRKTASQLCPSRFRKFSVGRCAYPG
ncbi:hypothetical protein CO656_17615 [Sinorhizobium sp. FG01]|nr:hypothetical protein CO656_17615 [Sinorhizobium sp. FG01]